MKLSAIYHLCTPPQFHTFLAVEKKIYIRFKFKVNKGPVENVIFPLQFSFSLKKALSIIKYAKVWSTLRPCEDLIAF